MPLTETETIEMRLLQRADELGNKRMEVEQHIAHLEGELSIAEREKRKLAKAADCLEPLLLAFEVGIPDHSG